MKSLLFFSLCFLAAACDSSSDPTETQFRATYEINAGCTTGLHELVEASESAIAQAFCDELVDQVANRNCGLYQREQIFKAVECSGTWPHNTPTGGGLRHHSYSYAYEQDGCSTGTHFFASTTDIGLSRLVCKALKDEVFNKYCAKASRDRAYFEKDCDAVL